MSQQAWYQHFKEQLQGLTDSFEKSGTSVSLLKYALQENRLSSEQYLAWARSHYLLPQLQSRFFTETSISQEMFARWATHYPWSEECLPVAEWDGSLIVACLQPPQDFPSNPTAIFVLADAENLQKTWKVLRPAKATIPASKPQEEAPEGIDLSAENFGSDVSSSDPLSEFGDEALGDSIPLPSEEKLDGLFEGATVVQLRPLSAGDAPTETPAEAPVAETVVAPRSAAQPEPALAPVATTESSIDKTVVAKIPRPGMAGKPTVNPVSGQGFELEKMKMKNAALLDAKVQKALSDMKVYFQKSLILTLDQQESQLTVFAWDENFKGMKDTSLRIPLKTPSIFNIVSSTQKPFHGYISLNEINEKFFEDWNQGQIPDHVTITPLIINDRMVGMIMGFAEKSAYNKATLNLAEKISQDFTQDLEAA